MSEWQRFAELLDTEDRLLGAVEKAALDLTQALVSNSPAQIDGAERRLEAQRLLHTAAYRARMTMQKNGFGELTLSQVCAYAPGPLRRQLGGTARTIATRAIALKMTVANNRALIVAGLERLAKTVAVLQRAGTERTGTYKRRGIIPPPTGSVLVSRRA